MCTQNPQCVGKLPVHEVNQVLIGNNPHAGQIICKVKLCTCKAYQEKHTWVTECKDFPRLP